MNGVINVYKPKGITSFDAVRLIKKVSKEKKVGHTGTLDPLASGVLPICLGKATKLVDYIMNGNKVYKAKMKLGEITDTYDREGKILAKREVNVTEKDVEEALKSFIGEILQVPPMYSALKVNGKKLYELARQGIEVERKARSVTIFNINISNIELPYVTFTVECSKGTYIRSLCYDIGEKLGSGAVMWELERCSSGVFDIDSSVKLDELTEENFEENLISIDECLREYESIQFDKQFEKLLINGLSIMDPRVLSKVRENTVYKVYDINGEVIGLGSLTVKGFKIIKLLT